jgi:hypothetical protein
MVVWMMMNERKEMREEKEEKVGNESYVTHGPLCVTIR